MNYRCLSTVDENLWKIERNNSEVKLIQKINNPKAAKLKFIKNKVKIWTFGVTVYLKRNDKIAKVSQENEEVIGDIWPNDKLYLITENNINPISEIILGKNPGVMIEMESEKRMEKMDTIFNYRSNQKTNITIGLIIIFLLLAGIVIGYQKNQKTILTKKQESAKTIVENELKKAEDKNTNSKEAVEAANRAAEKITELTGLKYSQNLLSIYQERVKTVLAKNGSAEAVEYDLAYDTDLIDNPNKKYSKIVLKKNELYLVDRENGRVEKVNLEMRSVEKLVSDEEIKNSGDFLLINDELLGFNGTTINQITRGGIKEKYKYEVKDQQLITTEAWNGSLYFLNNMGGIYKSAGENTIKDWLIADSDKEVGLIDLAIDGRVWVTNINGKIFIYDRGKKSSFNQSALPESGGIKKIILSTIGKQVVVVNDKVFYAFNKESGTLLGKYNLEKIGIKDAAMAEDGQSVIILGENQKIYRVKLRGEIF
jgi:hypothetical protein